MADFSEIMMNVFQERMRQDEKWGEQHHSIPYWNAILMEELGEAAEYGTAAHYRKEIVQSAAVAVQIVEAVDRGDYGPVEEQIFIHLNRLIKETGFLARAILDSRVGTTTGHATASDAIRILNECAIHAHAIRSSLLEEEVALPSSK